MPKAVPLAPLIAPDDRLMDVWDPILGQHRMPRWRSDFDDLLRGGDLPRVPQRDLLQQGGALAPFEPALAVPPHPSTVTGLPPLAQPPVVRPPEPAYGLVQHADPFPERKPDGGPVAIGGYPELAQGAIDQAQQYPQVMPPELPNQQMGAVPSAPAQPQPAPSMPAAPAPGQGQVTVNPQAVAQSAVQQPPKSNAAMWGLLAAGLGILANNRGNYGAAGPALGQGGLLGVKTAFEVQQNDEKNALAQSQQGLYAQQVRAQQAAQTRADEKEKIRGQFLERWRNAKPEDRPQIEREWAFWDDPNSVFNALNKPRTLKPLDRPVTQADGMPVMYEGQQLWEKFEPDESGVYQSKGKFVKQKIGGQTYHIQVDAAKKELGKYGGEFTGKYQEEAMGAMEAAGMLQVIDNALEDFDGGLTDEIAGQIGSRFPQGTLGDYGTAYKFSQSVALKIATSLKMPGAVSNFETKLYLDAVPSMLWSREGRKLAVALARKAADRKILLSNLMVQQINEKGYLDLVAINEYDKSLPSIFSKEEMAEIKRWSKAKPGAGPGASGTPADLYPKRNAQ